jgi:hypothetical protein
MLAQRFLFFIFGATIALAWVFGLRDFHESQGISIIPAALLTIVLLISTGAQILNHWDKS